MNRRKYLFIYLLTFILLLAHFAVAKFHSEPYPAFIFPSFSRVAPLYKNYGVPVTAFYAIDEQNDTIAVDKKLVLSPAEMSYPDQIAKTIRRKENIMNQPIAKRSATFTTIVAQRQKFLSLVKACLNKRYPHKRFKSLLIVQGLRIYNGQTQRISDTLQKKEITSISLE